MVIGIGSDHAGFEYKQMLAAMLRDMGMRVLDFGTDSQLPVDYPLFVHPVAKAVAGGECGRGIVLGGSGNGEAMAANKTPGIRCAVCWNPESARLASAHNNANMIALGQRMMSPDTARAIVQMWLDTPFQGGRHQRRIELIE